MRDHIRNRYADRVHDIRDGLIGFQLYFYHWSQTAETKITSKQKVIWKQQMISTGMDWLP